MVFCQPIEWLGKGPSQEFRMDSIFLASSSMPLQPIRREPETRERTREHSSASAIPYAASGAGGDWGKGNFLLNDQRDAGFQSIAEQDYRLSNSSRYRKKGTDGKDLGADIDAINAAISGAK